MRDGKRSSISALAIVAVVAAARPAAQAETRVTAQAVRQVWTLNGSPVPILELRVSVAGGLADSVLAVKDPVLRTARGARGRKLEVFADDTLFPPDPDAVRTPDRDAGNLGFQLTLRAPRRGTLDRIARAAGHLPVLAGGENHALRIRPADTGGEFAPIGHAALRKARVDLRLAATSLQAIAVRVEGPVRDLSVRTRREWHYGGGAGDRHVAIVEARGYRLRRGTTIGLTLENGERIEWRDLAVGEAPRRLRHDALAGTGVTVTASRRIVPVLRAKVARNAELLTGFRVEAGGETLAPVASDRSLEPRDDFFVGHWERPWPPGAEVVATVRAGARWQKLPFALRDVAVSAKR